MANLMTIEQNEIFIAVNRGQIEVLRRVANRNNIHFQIGDYDQSLLHHAAFSGHLDCAKFLLDMGINAIVRDNEGLTPLHLCVAARSFTNDREKIIKLLLDNGLSLEEKCNPSGNSVLHQASALSDAHMVQFLVDIGANVNATNNDILTPLHLACNYAKVENACNLLDHGADLLARDLHGRTPVDVAGNQKVVNAILTYQIGAMSRENTLLRQKLHDINNFTLATAFGSMDQAANANKKLVKTNEKIADDNKKIAETDQKIRAATLAVLVLLAALIVQYMFTSRK